MILFALLCLGYLEINVHPSSLIIKIWLQFHTDYIQNKTVKTKQNKANKQTKTS